MLTRSNRIDIIKQLINFFIIYSLLIRLISVKMVNVCDQVYSEKDYSQEWNPEEMAGNMILLGTNKIKQPVQVKVYRTSVEHFAVLYPLKKVCRPLGVLNLKNTMVERLTSWRQNHGFTVRQCGFDTPLCSLTFFSENGKELDRWINAFTSRNSTVYHTSSLPIVKEDDEL